MIRTKVIRPMTSQSAVGDRAESQNIRQRKQRDEDDDASEKERSLGQKLGSPERLPWKRLKNIIRSRKMILSLLGQAELCSVCVESKNHQKIIFGVFFVK